MVSWLNVILTLKIIEPRLRASPEQFFVMIDFMERHGDLLRPQRGSQERIKGAKLWQELAYILNSLGGGVQKSLDKWKKVWADWKTKTKNKYLCLRQQASGTGGGPSRINALTPLEERVVAMIGVSAVVEQVGIQELGFNRTSSDTVHDAGSTTEPENMSEDHWENTLFTPQPLPLHITSRVVTTPALATSPSPAQLPSQEPPPPPPPSTPPTRSNKRLASDSPISAATTPCQALLRVRRNRGLTPFERAVDLLATIEQRRLRYEEAPDKRLHQREMKRLRVEADRVEVARAHNLLLDRLTLIGQRLIDVITNTQHPVGNLTSTDPLNS